MKFLEDVEMDYAPPQYQKECSFMELSKFESFDESTNYNKKMEQSESSMTGSAMFLEEEKYLKRSDLENLKEENIINLNYIPTAEDSYPSWQLEDYFVL